MDIYEIRRQNLKRLLKQRFGGKQVRLASAIDRQPGYISRCLSDGAHRKRIGEDLARSIEASLDLQQGWLDQEQHRPGDLLGGLPRVGDLVREGKMGEAALEPSNIAPAAQPIRYHRYPVISRVQAGAWTECVTPYAPGAEPHEEATDYRAQGKAFWLEVQGDSMTAPPGARPSVPEGSLVLFDSGLEATPGKLVAAQLDDSNEATFKQLIEDGGRRYLRALNPAYPLIPINGNCRILGVAVEAKTRL
jgi:SOS-response transcriptional repressor LexA